MGIFRQNGHFSKVLVVWEVRVQALVVWGPSGERVVVWGAKSYFFQ
jgi:hypothetical protein